jgi:predicted MFS family arabinose efflux permease
MMLTISTSPPSRLAESIGYYGVSNLAMNAVAPAVAEIIADRFGWKPIFALAAVAGFLGFVLSRALPEERPVPGSNLKMWALARRPQSLAMIAIVTIWGWAFGAMLVFHQPLALSVGIDKVKGFFIAYTATAVLSRVGMGKIVDRIGRYGVSLSAFVLYAIVVFAMQALKPGLLEVLGAVFGIAHGLFFPAYSALVIERTENHERGKLMALSNAAFSGGLALSSVILGRVAEGSGYAHTFLVSGFVTSAGVILLVATTPSTRATIEEPAVARGSGDSAAERRC